MTEPKIPLWQETGPLLGIDHAAATTSDPQANIAFYEGVLGLELMRNTSTPCSAHGHLSYGQPGGDKPFLHFFINEAATKKEAEITGRAERLNLSVATSTVFEDSFWYWGDRLDAAGVRFEANADQPMVWFEDPDGLRVRLMIGYGDMDPEGPIEFKAGDPVPPKYQLTGLNGIELESTDPAASAHFMREIFGCELHDQRESWAKLIFNFCGGAFVHWHAVNEGSVGEAGSVHHVAVRCPSDQLEFLHARLVEEGDTAEEIMDHAEIDARCFMLKEPGGALLEVAASGA